MVFYGSIHEVCLDYSRWWEEHRNELTGSLTFDIDFPKPEYNLSNVELTVGYSFRDDT